MKKIWLLYFVFVLILTARENPFSSISELNTSVMTSNIKEQYDEFDKQNIKFPNDTNLLMQIAIKYRANDGSIKEKIISDVNKTIDTKDEYIIKRVHKETPQVTKNLDVSVTMAEPTVPKIPGEVMEQNAKIIKNNTTKLDINKSKTEVLKGIKTDINTSITALPSVTMLNFDTNKTIKKDIKVQTKPNAINNQKNKIRKIDLNQITKTDKKIEIKQKTTKKKTNIKQVKKLVSWNDVVSLFKLDADKSVLHIKTTEKMIKNFSFERSKIVIDFAKTPKSFYTKFINFNGEIFKNATIGWHDKYSRITVVLDKRRGYVIQKVDDGYKVMIKLK
ncbi:hypothetical protein KDD93_01880 [Campylobacter sp. faydin G-24]|uniref:AMIN domain-containing protein n=1 Tax=Campylobacter anatolicus TaxID=2829105 RepID=A0ABS5HGH6_9BACT|nr:hypothetical protein [Campylobacter anatolicus]MBR8463320.1 hypothetical protein [Campylobacter anatolicus]